jgi:uncharacterized protein
MRRRKKPCTIIQRRGYDLIVHEHMGVFSPKDLRDMEPKKTRIIPCPSCGKMAPYEKNPYRPFCSRACKGVDFIQWTDEAYRIAKDEQDEDSSARREGE